MSLKMMIILVKNELFPNIKHVKNYQNKLFFVPNLGVKATKNRNVLS